MSGFGAVGEFTQGAEGYEVDPPVIVVPGGPIDPNAVPPQRHIIFGGSTRVIEFEGSVRVIPFEGSVRIINFQGITNGN